ncbi:hypothetical protein CLI92_05900 [Vandammella animalimorsus]|uniref:Uncharacterized protein n=1 Tax=Vandammella animalimorsus TaxID=2029117 RepID=A0A2A2T671_9BURK|nr:hypothetical protein [Vandammella animalimorsus]PAX17078.1 hypothetical protein CLI92_05900 [Vandammella animalimorsus]PAX19051.1 hypothetical protein CLI93_09830 [Vandammella animalimorsus]
MAKKLKPAENYLPELVDNAAEKMGELVSTVAEQEKDEVFAAGVDVGRLEAMDFVATIATSAMLTVYENVKKSKTWRFLRNPESGDGRHFESLEEFCEVKLGRSYRRVRELAANRNLIGQEAFEQAERIGLRQTDYKAIKALPAPEQELVRRAVEEAQSKDEVVDLIQELAARTASHKAQAEEARAELAAKEQLLADKNSRIDALTSDLARASQRLANLPADQAWVELQREATGKAAEAAGLIAGSLRHALQTLHEAGEQMGRRDQVFMAGLLGQVEQEIHTLREQFALPLAPAAGRPEWQQWADAQDAAEAAEAAAQAMDAAH